MHQLIQRLKEGRTKLGRISVKDHSFRDFLTWKAGIQPLLQEVCPKQVKEFDQFFDVLLIGNVLYEGDEGARDLRTRLIAFINSAIDVAEHKYSKGTPRPSKALAQEEQDRRNVFVVHGHDEAIKQSVARVLEKLELSPIILHEQADGGKTIIEKFEKNASEVGFAIVLMSPDDQGYSKAEGAKKAKPRARQNVVMELGYFIGKLGRDKVMVLKRGDVEEPSDINGVVYTLFDDHDGWQQKLVRELRAAGYTVDANSL